MTYRDDRDADRARVESLESELAAARRRIAELEGRQETALVRADPTALATGRPSRGARIFGGPLHLELARRFDAALPAERFEDVLNVIRSIYPDHGVAEVLRSSLRWTALRASNGRTTASTIVEVTVEGGATTLVVRERLHQLAGGIYGGVGGGVGGGGISLPLLLSFAHPALAPVLFAGWFGAVFLTARTLYRGLAKRRAQRTQQLFDRVAEAIRSMLLAPVAAGDEGAR